MVGRLELCVVYGPSLGTRSSLHPSGITIGRGPSSSFHIPGRSLSRVHAWIRQENGAWFVHDTNSTNGVFVNGEQVCKAPIEMGDLISLGREVVLKVYARAPKDDEGEGGLPPAGGERGGPASAEAFVFLPRDRTSS